RVRGRAAAALAAFAFLAASGWLPSDAAAAGGEPLALAVRRIDAFGIARAETRFGALEFLGGIDITARDRRLGGLSGIDVGADGDAVTMVSDDGYLVRGRLVHENGRLVGLADAEIRGLFPVERDKFEADAEDLAFAPDGTGGLLAMERRRTPLLAFRVEDGWPVPTEPVAVPPAVLKLKMNRGLESVAYAPAASPLAGRAIIVAERAAERGAATIPAWILGGGAFRIVRRDDYDIASARFLPDGDLLVLERRFTPISGIAMRIRRIDGGRIRDGAELDGAVLIEAGMTDQIDNMEGLAVHREASGRVVLTLVSDDNKSILQRTLLLQFAIAAD
ncbi:esterase-like activity of phytase family protein, partial [Propylenella binzhouense]